MFSGDNTSTSEKRSEMYSFRIEKPFYRKSWAAKIICFLALTMFFLVNKLCHSATFLVDVCGSLYYIDSLCEDFLQSFVNKISALRSSLSASIPRRQTLKHGWT